MAKVLIKTSLGDITVRLYDETPQHRDNFLKLAREGFYNGTIFHRVIKNFMIQGGDPESKNAPMSKPLGSGDAGYTIPAEFVYPQYFHKKGALAAARTGDEVNPERRSSGCQFYIVTGEVYSAGKLTQLEKQMAQQQLQNIFNQLVVENRDKILEMRKNRDNAGLQQLQEELEKQTYAKAKELGDPKFTDAQREAYTTVGGTPFLDNNYTVFGEVVEGLEVADKIQQVETAASDRPKEDVKMISVEIVEE
ncbi:MAG: peptidylprolyl isomerase [Bacteroidales bacterium]|jgi:peptidyl-prolyl cis-trans isomerase B (cyclophilin B)|nr:peptidylprolyl isomerase [Bacteroidales bacterium]